LNVVTRPAGPRKVPGGMKGRDAMPELFSEATVNELMAELQKETKLRQDTEDALRRATKEIARLQGQLDVLRQKLVM
jgi:predicted  nucleic acid-binding Zn-ribbon protein